MRNKVKTCGYFKKRLKDNGFIVLDVFKSFNDKDKRKWCLLINPGQESIFCTCYANFDNEVSVAFAFNDGGKKIPKNFFMATPSMESIITQLIVTWGVNNNNKSSTYYKKR